MDLNKTQSGEKTVFSLAGRLDTTTAPQLLAELIPEFDTAKEIVLDLKQLVYISSAGLRVLVMGEKTAKNKAGRMTLVNVQPEIMSVFEMTGFTDILEII